MHVAASVLPQLVLPIGLTLILALAGLALGRRWLVVLAVTVLYLTSTPLLSNALMRAVEGDQIRILASDATEADAIVVLSQRRRVAPGPAGVSGWDTAERFLAGLELVAAERAPWLVFTGGWTPRAPGAPLEGDLNRRDAVALGVPEAIILTTVPVRNTAEEAVAVAALLRERGIGDAPEPHVLLVTSAFHVPRAQALFERQGLRVTPFPVDFRVSAARRPSALDLLPGARALQLSETALRELYGRAAYRVR
jgi:uncharacterized SAM-binding protein YcdF (DUF218 family)